MLKKILKFVGLLYIILIIAIIIFGFANNWVKRQIDPLTVLEFNFERTFTEGPQNFGYAALFEGKSTSTLDVVSALERASNDKRVWGLVARVGESNNLSMAQIQEIRDAVIEFRAKGKKAIAWAETFGEFGPGNKSYYLATAFDKIYLVPTGDLGLTGLFYGVGFVSGTLNKLNVEPELRHRYQYKNFMNMFTEKKFTKPHKEALLSVMNSQFNQLVTAISEARGMAPPAVERLIDKAPYLAQEAKEKGLVDGLLYEDEVYDRVMKEAGEGAALLYLRKYLSYAGGPWREGKVIALIQGKGPINRGKSSYDPMLSTFTMGSDTLTNAFEDAIRDDKVKAIVFRVDSPGGSAVASDVIAREIEVAKRKGKPVIISMGNVAASGGYWISMNATKIVAEPGTITGSIGVLGGKFYTRNFWNKLGVTWDEVHTSRNSTMWSTINEYSTDEQQKVDLWLDNIYQDFVSKVARGRGMSEERVHQIAKGRIWTGEQAKKLGLVDALGGYKRAIRLAKEASGIPISEPIRLKYFPKRKSVFQRLLDYMIGGDNGRSSGAEVRFTALNAAVKMGEPFLKSAYILGREPGESAVLTPFYLFNTQNPH